MKKTIKIFLAILLLLAGNMTDAQVFKHLWRGAPGAALQGQPGGGIYSGSTADTFGNLHILICDTSRSNGGGSSLLKRTYHIETWNGALWINSADIILFTKKRFAADVVRAPAVYKMMIFKGSVIIAGKFDSSSNNLGGGIVAWDGLQWAGVGDGLFVSSKWKPNSFQSWFEMKNVFEFKSKLVIAGNFDSIAGAYVNGAAQLNSSGKWENLAGIKGNVPFQMHRPDAAHFFQVIAPEIDVALDSMYFYQSIYYVPDKLGFNGVFDTVMNSRQSKLWPLFGIMGTTLYVSDGLKNMPVSIPKDFVVRRVFEHNGELSLMGHFDSSIYMKQVARRDAKGKWNIYNLPDNDSLATLNKSGLATGYYKENNKYIFLGRLRTGVLKLYTYNVNGITGNNVLKEDDAGISYGLVKSGGKKYLAGSFLHLESRKAAKIDSFFNYAAEILGSKTMVIRGRAFVDRNLDKTWQAGEPLLKHRMLYWKDSTFVSCTDAKGEYILYLPSGTGREIKIQTNSYYLPAWAGSKVFSSTEDTVIYVDFPMAVTTGRDLKVELIAYRADKARRGEVSKYAIRVSNISGKAVKSIDVRLRFAKKITEFKSIGSPVIINPAEHTAYWNFPGTLPGDSSFYIYFSCKYGADSFVYGDSVYHSVSVTNNYADADTLNNVFSIKQFISSAYDPNLKESNPNGKLTKKPDQVYYTVYFQNEGNDTAIKVQVVDTLKVITPVYEVEVGAASHPFHFSVENGIMVWEFENIRLTTMEENLLGSCGFLAFTARINKPLKIGDSIRNRAGIYFDYEKPVLTNYASIVMVKKQDISVPEINELAGSFSIFPNPFHDLQTIRNQSGNKESIKIYNSSGSLMTELEFEPLEERIVDMGRWASGIYLLVTEGGESLRVVKM